MTTFTSREVVRDALYTLFNAYTGSGQPLQKVFNNWPKLGEAKGLSPILIMTSAGTRQEFENLNTNPAAYRIRLTSLAIAGQKNDTNVTRAAAMDKIDQLDTLVRQVIRDNVQNNAWNNIEFEPSFTEVETILFEGLPYMVETHVVITYLSKGAI